MSYKTYRDWPKQALKLIVLIACSTAVIFQLSECIMKLSYPPVSTHTELDVNNSLSYPAITICRNTPYKPDVLKKHNLGSDIRYTSEWKNFTFSSTSLSAFWTEATYTRSETIVQYGLNKKPENVALSTSMYFVSGRCHTLRPLVTTLEAGKTAGYSVTLRHSTNTAEHQPWHVYVHQPSDVWTENALQTTGVQELVLLGVGEEVQVKLAVQELSRVNHPRAPCHNDLSYSATKCEEQCRWSEMSQAEGCSVPWMQVSGLPECDDYNRTFNLIREYLRFTSNPGCSSRCGKPCFATQFSTYIVNRGSIESSNAPLHFSQLYLFHTSKLVTTVREHWDYDLSRFVADAGGSLGFLLGISVLSLVSLLVKGFRAVLSCGSPAGMTRVEGDSTSQSSSDGSIHSRATILAGSNMKY